MLYLYTYKYECANVLDIFNNKIIIYLKTIKEF